MKTIETKNTAGGSTKDVDTTKRIVTGYLSNFGNIDLDNDIIEKGAFAKTLMERKSSIFFLNQHNWQQPLSKFQTLMEDDKGLFFESNPIPDTTYGNDVLKLYEAGVLDQHSIGFSTIISEYNKLTDCRIIKEVKLYEGSVVTMAANPKAVLLGVKSYTLEEVQSKEKQILKAFKNGTFTDETFILLEIALKELSLQSYELGKLHSLKENEPIKITLNDLQPSIIETLKNFNL
jgi:HK97 family phage prohead protease